MAKRGASDSQGTGGPQPPSAFPMKPLLNRSWMVFPEDWHYISAVSSSYLLVGAWELLNIYHASSQAPTLSPHTPWASYKNNNRRRRGGNVSEDKFYYIFICSLPPPTYSQRESTQSGPARRICWAIIENLLFIGRGK